MAEAVPPYRDAMGAQVGELLGLLTPRVRRYPASAFLRCALASFFSDRLFSSYEIQSWKPEPDLFLHAARKMGAEPQDCVVVEDSKLGVEAARRAGMRALRYDPHSAAEMPPNPRERSFTDMNALPELIAG